MLIGNIEIRPGRELFFIAGPCVIENAEDTVLIAEGVQKISKNLKIPAIFKASFDKANRTSIDSFRGPGLEKGLEVLDRVRRTTGLPVVSDIHETWQAAEAGRVLDMIQIPAFLCRQTDLILRAAETGKPINIKKGQFMAPWDMAQAVKKAMAGGADKIVLTERGNFFGYNNLVVDMRAFAHLKSIGCPVVFDATHAVQRPAGRGDSTGGDREMIPLLAGAAVAAGCDGVFFETHPNPDQALSDGPNMIRLNELEDLVARLIRIRAASV